jgi:hypothetical protein
MISARRKLPDDGWRRRRGKRRIREEMTRVRLSGIQGECRFKSHRKANERRARAGIQSIGREGLAR